MVRLTLEHWKSKTVEVDWLNLQGGVTRLPIWSASPEVIASLDIRPVTEQYPADCTMWVVPQSFRDFVSNIRPCLTVKHHNTASGQRLLEGTTFMIPFVYVQSVMLRLSARAQ